MTSFAILFQREDVIKNLSTVSAAVKCEGLEIETQAAGLRLPVLRYWFSHCWTPQRRGKNLHIGCPEARGGLGEICVP